MKKSTPGKSVLAIAAHPDDIEFSMAGTLFLLQRRGWNVHYMNIGTGSGGSSKRSPAEMEKIRCREAKAACALAGFHWHRPVTRDLTIQHVPEQLARIVSVVRTAKPDIILTQSLQDYMEDHQNTARLAATAGFCKGSTNAPCKPVRPLFQGTTIVYHALPHGFRDAMGKLQRAGLWVDISSVMEAKEAMLTCHASQRQWLADTQGMDSYTRSMTELSAAMGRMSGKYANAEGWRRHNPLGYSPNPAFDPLRDALADVAHVDEKYEKWLNE